MEDGKWKIEKDRQTESGRDRSAVAAWWYCGNHSNNSVSLRQSKLLRAGTTRAPDHGIANRFVAKPVCWRSNRNPRVSTC
jgi:hypothetical protein